MADETPVVAPGSQTSEYKVTLITTVLTIAATVVPSIVTVLTDLQMKFPAWGWIAGIISVLGIVGTILNALGYTRARAQVKVAALEATAATAAAKVGAAEAANNLAKS